MRNLKLALVIFALIIFAGVSNSFAEKKIKVGFIGPLTGKASFLAVDSVEVLRRLIDKKNSTGGIKGNKIDLIVADDSYETSKTLSGYQKLVHIDDVKVLFAFTYGGVIALADRANKDGVIVIDTLDCDDEIASLSENVFCVAKKTEDLGVFNARHALKHNNYPAGIIYFDGDPFLPKVAKATRDTLIAGGGEVTVFEGVSVGTQDFRSLLLKLKAKGVKAAFFYGYDDFGLAMKQGREIGLEAQYYSLTGVNSPGFLSSAGSTVNGAFTAGWFAPRTQAFNDFIAEHQKQVRREPLLEVSTIPTYDVGRILISGIEESIDENGALNIDQLSRYLYSLKNYQGLSGNISMDSDGAVRSLKVGMYKFVDGKFVDVD
ncbi:MAG: ABC transporter substrate-binding protein [Pseudomonadota bacterium]|jgi:ABC-type branched-subunit amino acid transport system substrate-binding protein